MSVIPSPRLPLDAEGGPDEQVVQSALDEIAEHLGPLDEVTRERMRRRVLGEDCQD